MGWKYRDGAFGNSEASIVVTLKDGNSLKATVYDCDGDVVEWAVRKFVPGGEVLASGDVKPEDGPEKGKSSADEAWAFDEAMQRCCWFISRGTE